MLPFHLPDIGEEEIASVTETLRSGWLTTGPKTKRFEADFAKFVGAPHAVAVNSCTAALHLALEAVGIKEGDEVLIPAMTFAATAEVVVYFKAKPVLVDCEPGTLNLDADAAARAVTARTKAIVPVHFAGQACDMDRILELARDHNLKVIEDAAHALPATYRGKTIGTIGDITCFSLYATKTITTGEGGMATTTNADYAERMRSMSLHGISRNGWTRYTAAGSWYYEILQPGFKYNLTDIASAIGLEQLRKCNRFWVRRQEIAEMYNQAFADMPELVTPVKRAYGEHAWHLYVLQLSLERLGIDRDQFIEELKQRDVGVSVHFIPLHLHPYYRDTLGYWPEHLPQASAAFRRIVSLPIYPRMSDEEVHRVIDAVREVAKAHARGAVRRPHIAARASIPAV